MADTRFVENDDLRRRACSQTTGKCHRRTIPQVIVPLTLNHEAKDEMHGCDDRGAFPARHIAGSG